ncbi:glycosyltransferase family 2 protein [Flammeovirga pacifica]|uniref:Glycosyltransferase 2-like domain-containing protein n=1 Tax=Flammeovirga pacifica TaxID=915059 RepID=A0A1S1YX09_FLAPC|nr:glycosyltransferase family 2 protein [Flammeovirga pacifica]OHX65560.1 hypothetical protein NH26_03955 [Flammeovirga pacifica]
MISIIIPVFNAEKYLIRAIKSVLAIDLEKEIILIEDSSPDDSINICRDYVKKYPKLIKLYQHPDKKNHGAGPSRNLGIEKANGKYISFLDADDYYLPNRFNEDIEILNNNNDIDATYGVIGVEYHSKIAKEKHLKRMIVCKSIINNKNLPIDFTGIEEKIKPQNLFYALITGKYGWIHLNGLTLRKSSIQKMELFRDLRLGQDTDFIWRLSFEKCMLGISNNRPIAIRNVHDENRILDGKVDKIDWQYWYSLVSLNNGDLKSKFFLLNRISEGDHLIFRLFFLLKKMVFKWN